MNKETREQINRKKTSQKNKETRKQMNRKNKSEEQGNQRTSEQKNKS